MTKTFLYADPHFSHEGVCRFTREDGSKLRPFDTVEEMDEILVEKYNAKVSPEDKVYFLGDIAFKKKHIHILHRLNGRKVLIKGNHDTLKLNDYIPFFYDIRACHILDKLLLSHIPIHRDSIGRFRGNVHGHLHYRSVRLQDGSIDPLYLCVSVEHTDYAPIDFEEVREIFKSRIGE